MPPTRKPRKEKKAKACRICLSANGENRVTFDVESEWTRLLEYCVGITISAENGPRVLCEKCSLKLKEYSEFKTLALKSNALWNNVFTDKLKKDPVESDPVEIKDENNDNTANFQDDTEYHDVDFESEFPTDSIKEEEMQDDIKIDTLVKDESELQEEQKNKKVKAKINKIPLTDKEKISKENFKGLSENEFIKKFYEVTTTTKKGRTRSLYECLKCGNEFKRRSGLALHVQKCHESEVLIVKKNKETEKTNNVTPEIFDCGLCAFQNVEEEVVLQHLNQQHCLTNDFNCKLCDYVGRDTADMVSHRYTHVPENFKYRGKYRCPTCYKITLNDLCLQFHYRNLHLKKPGGWCSICNKIFSGYIYFRNHMRLHMEAKYICDLCGAKFLFRNLIVAHIQEHMNIRNYVCDTCGKSFKRNNALSGHIRAYHTEYKPVPCDHCDKYFKNAYSLRLHMKMVKKGNNYICDVCCKGYPTMSLLKKHMFWHTGERPFSCETCGGKYKSKGNLKLHMRKHMGIYPFKCDSCEKQFMTSTQLKAHSSVHTGIRRVKCLVCDKTFHEKRQMLAHCQSKHESFMAKCDSQSSSLLIPIQATQIQELS